MNKKIILYALIAIMFIMPIVSIEDIIPWVVTIFFINLSVRRFKVKDSIKPVVINTVFCGVIIVVYNVLAIY